MDLKYNCCKARRNAGCTARARELMFSGAWEALAAELFMINFRVDVTPAKRGRGQNRQENEDKTLEQRHQAMTWAPLTGQALADTSDRCIEDQAVIDKILAYLIKKGALPPPPELLPAARGNSFTEKQCGEQGDKQRQGIECRRGHGELDVW